MIWFRKMLSMDFPERHNKGSSLGKVSQLGSRRDGFGEYNRDLGNPVDRCMLELTAAKR